MKAQYLPEWLQASFRRQCSAIVKGLSKRIEILTNADALRTVIPLIADLQARMNTGGIIIPPVSADENDEKKVLISSVVQSDGDIVVKMKSDVRRRPDQEIAELVASHFAEVAEALKPIDTLRLLIKLLRELLLTVGGLLSVAKISSIITVQWQAIDVPTLRQSLCESVQVNWSNVFDFWFLASVIFVVSGVAFPILVRFALGLLINRKIRSLTADASASIT